MAVTERDTTNAGQSSSALETLTIDKPTGTIEGDLIIASICHDTHDIVVTPPVGFTAMSTITNTTTMEVDTFYKEAGASEPADYEFGMSSGGTVMGTISSFYDTDGKGTWTLEDDSANRVVSNTSITSTSVTAVDNSILFISYCNDDDETISSAAPDMTPLFEGNVSSIAIATYFELRDAGGVTKSVTWSGLAEELTAQPSIFSIEITSSGTNTQINIGDAWKEIPTAQINIGDAWKVVAGMQLNIGDAWKEVF